MSTTRVLAALAATAFLAAPAWGAQAPAAVNTYQLIPGGVNAVIWRPATPGPHANVVLVGLHDNGNNMDHMSGPQLARRGYTIINANPRTAPDASDSDTDWNKDLVDVGAVVKFARAMPGVTRVVLLGHSSGGPLMASYQNIAENGVKACNGPEKIFKCPDSLAGLPKADGLIVLDPIWGVGANVLNSMEPAITDQGQPRRLDPALDSYRPQNGYAEKGSNYSAAFKRRFFAAQAARNNRLIRQALVRNGAIDAGAGRFVDDEPFTIPGATRRPRLWPTDLHLLSRTKNAWPLLRADGRVTTEVIRSVRPTSGTTPTSPTLNGGGVEHLGQALPVDLRDAGPARLRHRRRRGHGHRLGVGLHQHPQQRGGRDRALPGDGDDRPLLAGLVGDGLPAREKRRQVHRLRRGRHPRHQPLRQLQRRLRRHRRPHLRLHRQVDGHAVLAR
jgi:hypothetical protein